jgi:quinol monooxygenase YgiN
LWESGEWTKEKNEAVLKEHLRTPYIHKWRRE